MVQNVCFLTIFSNALHKVKEISIFSNDNHLEWMVRLSDIFLKRDHPTKYALNWPTGFKEYFQMIFGQNTSNLHISKILFKIHRKL